MATFKEVYIASDIPTPREVIECEECKSIVLCALNSLPEKQRLALTLRYFEGKTLAEIAEAIELSIPTVSYHIERGLEKLSRMLRGYGVE